MKLNSRHWYPYQRTDTETIWSDAAHVLDHLIIKLSRTFDPRPWTRELGVCKHDTLLTNKHS